MKELFLISTILAASSIVRAQGSQTATIDVVSSACQTPNSCLIVQIPNGTGSATFTQSSNSGTIQFEALGGDGSTWVALNATPSNGRNPTSSSAVNGASVWQASVAAYLAVRIRLSGAGSATVAIATSTASVRDFSITAPSSLTTKTETNEILMFTGNGDLTWDRNIDLAEVNNGASFHGAPHRAPTKNGCLPYYNFTHLIPILVSDTEDTRNSLLCFDPVGSADSGGSWHDGILVPQYGEIAIADIASGDMGIYGTYGPSAENNGFDFHIQTVNNVNYARNTGSWEWDGGGRASGVVITPGTPSVFEWGAVKVPDTVAPITSDDSAIMKAGSFVPKVYTVGTLPSATGVAAGTIVVVSDSLNLSVGVCTGGGSTTMLAVSNGTAWSCH